MATPSGADTLANGLLTTLLDGRTFDVPETDLSDALYGQPPSTGELYTPVEPLEIADLTTGLIDGNGAFDKLMTSLVAHLKVEFSAGRISGAEYTKAYIGIVSQALQTATQFLLGKDQSYWQAVLVQQQARLTNIEATRARVELETAKAAFAKAQFDAYTAEANYGLTKIRISIEDVNFANLEKTGIGIERTNDNLASQKIGIDYTNNNILTKQSALLGEQIEVQRAQTMDIRTDLLSVEGLIGKQKDLYDQQITSYQRDAETKAVKMWVDAWITQKTIDEGLLAPDQFTNTNLDAVLSSFRTNLSL